jgi:HlyD family secretion protein
MKKSGKKIITILIIIVVIVIAGIIYKKHNKVNVPQFATVKVSKGKIEQTVMATGTVNPIREVDVGARVSGLITNIYPKPLDYNLPVKKGQLLAVIDPSPYEIALNQAKAQLLQSKATLIGAEATLANNKLTMERDQKLYKQNFIAKSQLDNDTTAYNNAQAAVEADQQQIKASEENVKNAEINLGYTQIYSPINGVVVSQNVQIGQTVASSFQTPTLFLIAQDLTKMEIDTSMSEANIGGIKKGDSVIFSVYAYPQKIFKGIVSQVRISPTTVQNVVTYDVVVGVNNDKLLLLPGMTANVTIIVAKKQNVLKIPNSALMVNIPSASGKQVYHKTTGVWILQNNKPQWASIKTGISSTNYTEVVSGLKEGEKVITGIKNTTNTGNQPRRGMFF